jgi:hypothetical protein
MTGRAIQLSFGITLSVFFILSGPDCQAQTQLSKIKEWSSGEISNAAVDRLGNFLLIYKKGGIKKYDPNGKVMASLRKSKPTLIEPWYHPSIFIYDRGTQKYFSYGRFFENVQEHKLPPEFAIEPYLICPTHDNRLWILDQSDYSLKKINPLSNEVQNEFVLNAGMPAPAFTFLKEYQNLIFLQEKNAIWIINTLGKVINKIEGAQLGNFGFFGQELYYLESNTVRFINLLTEESYELKLDGDLKFALVTDERILTITKNNKVTLYNYIP